MNITRLAVLIACVCVIAGCSTRKKNGIIEERAVVSRVNLRDAIIQTGEVEPVVKVELKSEASGVIQKVYVKEGQRIKKGDKIIDIDPSRLLYKKEALDLSVKKARIQADIAKRNYEDAQKLVATGTVSEKQLADLKNAWELAVISYEQEKLSLKDITDQLNKTKVVSPMNGIITSLDVEEGEIAVSATSGFQSGTSIATIADISELEVVSQIGEVDYIHLKQGQKVVIKPEAIEGVQTTGTINFIALSAKKQSADGLGTFEVRVRIDSLIPGIAPGINVNVEFVILEKEGILGIPNRFVTRTPKGWFVNKVIRKEDGTESVKQIPVTVGKTDYRYYEILSGVKEGDVVLFKEVLGKDKNDQRKRSRGRR